jgi:hypothetical protein
MKRHVMLTIASMLSILLITFHLTDDILYHGGMSPGGVLLATIILVVWLCGTLLLVERRSGYLISALGALLAVTVEFVHMMAAGGVVAGGIAKSGPPFFFVWTLLMLGVTGTFSFILSVLGFWNLQRAQSRPHTNARGEAPTARG